MTTYPHLFSPLRIGNLTVRNRIMQTAHVKLFAHDAVDSQRNVAYQVARAKGGAGLLITGNRVVHPTSTTGFPRVAWAYLPDALRGRPAPHRRRPRARRGDLRAAQPLRPERVERLGRRPARALGPVGGEVARVRRDAEGDGDRGHPRGRRVVGALGRAARARAASTAPRCTSRTATCCTSSSRRSTTSATDEYGGSFENRLRFSREVIAEVRRRAGDDWVVGIRISLSDFIAGRARRRGRGRVGADARGRRRRSTTSTSRRPATTTSSGRSSRPTRRTATSSTSPRRSRPRAGASGVHRRRDQGPRARRGDPRRRARRTWSR